jgi:hypothetical protein
MDCLNKLYGCLNKLYGESGDEKYSPSASVLEAFLLCLSIISFIVFILLVEWWGNFAPKHLFILFPAVLWMFLRASRKDMKATGNMIAGSIGAIGGALFVIVAKLILK